LVRGRTCKGENLLFLSSYLGRFDPGYLYVDVFAFYIYHWALNEITDYTTKIFYQNTDEQQNQHDWERLRDYLPPNRMYIRSGVAVIRKTLEDYGILGS
jgi:hypothetical protein